MENETRVLWNFLCSSILSKMNISFCRNFIDVFVLDTGTNPARTSCILCHPHILSNSILIFVLSFRAMNPGSGEIFRTRPDRPWGPPSLLYNEYRVFTGGEAAGTWC
jgi:hypothetical protein